MNPLDGRRFMWRLLWLVLFFVIFHYSVVKNVVRWDSWVFIWTILTVSLTTWRSFSFIFSPPPPQIMKLVWYHLKLFGGITSVSGWKSALQIKPSTSQTNAPTKLDSLMAWGWEEPSSPPSTPPPVTSTSTCLSTSPSSPVRPSTLGFFLISLQKFNL